MQVIAGSRSHVFRLLADMAELHVSTQVRASDLHQREAYMYDDLQRMLQGLRAVCSAPSQPQRRR